MYYSLVLFMDKYVELLETYPSLTACLKAAEPVKGICIEVSLLYLLGGAS
jgi:hypothetical protein